MTTAPGLTRIARLSDPTRRAAEASDLLRELKARRDAEEAAILEVRDRACRELLEDGKSYAHVARVIRRTRSLVSKRFPEYSERR